jgi:hypothetical protein
VDETCSMHGQVCGLQFVGKGGFKLWNEYSLVEQKNVGWPDFFITEPNFQEFINEIGDSQGAAGYFKIFFSFNLCVLFFRTATTLLGQIVIKLFGPNYLIKESISYFFWSSGAIQKLLRHQGYREQRKFGNRWTN